MNTESVISENNLGLYVKNIFVLQNADESKKSLLPFFADGYPGIMFQQTTHEAVLHPKNKKLSAFFLYGQTIHPIEIGIEGSYRLIVFQLQPFATRTLFGVNAKELNDDCYDLNLTGSGDVPKTIENLLHTSEIEKQVEIIAKFLAVSINDTIQHSGQKIQLAINLILSSQGKITVKALTEHLHLTERTLQRQFAAYVGVSPKQFSKIIQFQSSMNQISDEAFSRLTDVVYENGYADQSHFIRSFKKFTGKKPSAFKSAR